MLEVDIEAPNRYNSTIGQMARAAARRIIGAPLLIGQVFRSETENEIGRPYHGRCRHPAGVTIEID